MKPGLGIETQATLVEGECSHHCTTPAPPGFLVLSVCYLMLLKCPNFNDLIVIIEIGKMLQHLKHFLRFGFLALHFLFVYQDSVQIQNQKDSFLKSNKANSVSRCDFFM